MVRVRARRLRVGVSVHVRSSEVSGQGRQMQGQAKDEVYAGERRDAQHDEQRERCQAEEDAYDGQACEFVKQTEGYKLTVRDSHEEHHDHILHLITPESVQQPVLFRRHGGRGIASRASSTARAR